MVELSFIENIQNVCRLCLRSEENMQDIFQCTDSYKIPLIERIFLFYQVKIAKEDGLPNKICKDCLDFTETFTSYHNSVQKCEAKLQALICTAGALGTKIQHNKTLPSSDSTSVGKSNSNYTEILPDDDCEVVVIDPNQDYESSDESFSEGEYTPPTSRSTPQPVSNNEVSSRTTTPVTETITSNNSNSNSNSNSNDQQEAEVVDLELENRNAFLCQYCDRAFIGATECAEHERHHDNNFPYSCVFCPFRCPDRQILINHIKDNHNDKPYVCVVCSKGFGRRSDLKKHAIVHTGIRPFQCSVCNKSFSRNTNLTKHMRIHTGSKPFVCQKCPRSFTTAADLEKHQKVHDYSEKPFKCPKCDASFNRKDKLQSHFKIHLKKEANDAIQTSKMNPNGAAQFISNLPSFNRPIGIENFGNELNMSSFGNAGIMLKDSTNFSNDNMVFPLDSFGSRNNINPISIMNNPNMISNFDNRPNEFMQHQFLQSKIQFPQQQQQMLIANNPLQQHSTIQQIPDLQHLQPQFTMENMMMPPPPPIQSGGINVMPQYKILSQQQQKQQKIKSEPPEKQKRSNIHICSICAKVFTRKRELQRHVVIHSGQKPFACSFCGKRFNRKDKLLRHEKIHRDGKFPCPKCKLDFAKQETLDIHLQLHEKVERASQQQQQQRSEPEEQVQPKVPNFLQSLQVGVTPQLNFYSDTI